MTMHLLSKLAREKFPVVVEGGNDVDAVHILKLAGHVEAVLAKAVKTPSGWLPPTATVMEITPSGQRILKTISTSLVTTSAS
jgi:hypothetical protein